MKTFHRCTIILSALLGLCSVTTTAIAVELSNTSSNASNVTTVVTEGISLRGKIYGPDKARDALVACNR